jgi:hypothetical protein
MFTQHAIEIQSPAIEYIVAEPAMAGQIAREPHVEEDGVDWCAWWAEYAEMME